MAVIIKTSSGTRLLPSTKEIAARYNPQIADLQAAISATMPQTGGTFTGEIAFPEKTDAVSNVGTVPASEAQVYQVARRAESNEVYFGATSTAASTVNKIVELEDLNYVPKKGDFFVISPAITSTSTTVQFSINGTAARYVRLGATNVSTASGSAGYCAAGGAWVVLYDGGDYYRLLGSLDLADADTTAPANINGIPASSFTISANSDGGSSVYYSLIGLTDPDNNIVDKITATANLTTDGDRVFTLNPVSYNYPIYYAAGSSTPWVTGSALPVAAAIQYAIGTSRWKYAIGNYYNKSGVLVLNSVTTDLLQVPLYLGGTKTSDGFFYSE